jgi:hypothetical protein
MSRVIAFQIRLNEDEFQALRALAQREYRDFRQQAGILIRKELIACGAIEDRQSGQSEPVAYDGVQDAAGH